MKLKLNIPVYANILALTFLFSAVSQGKQFETVKMATAASLRRHRELPLTDDIEYLQKNKIPSHTQNLYVNDANRYLPKNISNIRVYRRLRSADRYEKGTRKNRKQGKPQRKRMTWRHDRKRRKLFYVDGRSSTINYPRHHRRRHLLRRYPIAHRRRTFSFETQGGYDKRRRHWYKPMYRSFRRHRIDIISGRKKAGKIRHSSQRAFNRRMRLLEIPEQRRKKYLPYRYRHSYIPYEGQISRRGGTQTINRKTSYVYVKRKHGQRNWRRTNFGKRTRNRYSSRERARGIDRKKEYLPRFKADRQHRHKRRRFFPNKKQKKILWEVREKRLHKRIKEVSHRQHGKTRQGKKIMVNDFKKVNVFPSGNEHQETESSRKSQAFINAGQPLESPCKDYRKKLEKMAAKINRSLHKASILAKIIGKKFGINEEAIDKILKKEEEKVSDRFLAMLYE